MLKFRPLLITTKSRNLHNLFELQQQELRLFETNSATLHKFTKKQNKYSKQNRKNKKLLINAVMDLTSQNKNHSPSTVEATPTTTTTTIPTKSFMAPLGCTSSKLTNDKNSKGDNCSTTTAAPSSSLSSSNMTKIMKSSTSIKLSQNDRIYTRRYRQWEDTDLGSEINQLPDFLGNDNSSSSSGNAANNGNIFTLVSYNILAQDLLQLHQYLYVGNDHNTLQWSFRLDKIRREILTLRPEILCLQEVQNDHLPAIADNFKQLDFDYVFKKKTGIRSDGCAIFYNKNLFYLIERHSVEYFQPGIEYLNRENIGIIVKLCLKTDPSACFIVATTHLLYNPRRQDVRLAQVQVLLAELDRISINGFTKSDQPKRLPIILTGDFNLMPKSAPYNLITTGNLYYYNLTAPQLENPNDNGNGGRLTGKEFLPARLGITDNCQHIDLVKNHYQGQSRLKNTDTEIHGDENATNNHTESISEEDQQYFSTGKLTHDLNLASVYQHKKFNEQREATTFQERWITVDYIFYSKHLNATTDSQHDGYLKLLSRYSLPTVDQCHAIGRIPNYDLGSDHLSLGAKFFLQAPKKSKI